MEHRIDGEKKYREVMEMSFYESLLNNHSYLEVCYQIEQMKFITDGKWDWEHGLGHYQRVAMYAKKILERLGADERIIDLGMVAALLHDIGLCKGKKVNHALESSNLFIEFIHDIEITEMEKEMLGQAIRDHSDGNDIKSLIGLSLLLADKLDVTYHRTQNSSIQDDTNQQIQKIRSVDIHITDTDLILMYEAESGFDIMVLNAWKKAITIPKKVSKYLEKNFIFMVNGCVIDYQTLFQFQ